MFKPQNQAMLLLCCGLALPATAFEEAAIWRKQHPEKLRLQRELEGQRKADREGREYCPLRLRDGEARQRQIFA